MSILRFIPLFIIFVLYSSLCAAQEDYEVLILHSYSRDSVWTNNLDMAIKDNLISDKGRIVFYTEYMDTKRFTKESYDKELKELLELKYRNTNIKLIITTDDNAFNFVMDHRSMLFSESGIIFTGVNNLDDKVRKLDRDKYNFTGLLENYKIEETIKMALRIHPSAKKIYILNTIHSTSGKALKKEFLKAIANLGSNLKFEFLEDYKYEDLYNKVQNLDPNSFMLFGTYSRDHNGQFLNFEKSLARLSNASNIPIYGFLEYYLHHGLTGGLFTSAKMYGRGAAQIGVRFLKGESLGSIDIVKSIVTPALFDYRNISRYGIDISKLPDNAKIINHENKLMEFYRDFTIEFWFIVFSFIFVFVILIVLFYNFDQQKKHKVAVQRINAQLEERVKMRTQQLVEQQSKLIDSAKLASIGEMASGIAHEINNPLTIIDLCAFRITQLSQEPVVVKSSGKIKSTVDRISKIIQGLKQLSKEDSTFSHEPVNINEAIEDIISICISKFNENQVDFSSSIDENLIVRGSSVQISQVILNLLNNAFDEVVKSDGERWIKLVAKKSGEFAEISVMDSGAGIQEDILEKIMEPFFTTKVEQRGTGLGLSICKNIIEHHEGRIFVDQTSPNTKFVIQIPLATS